MEEEEDEDDKVEVKSLSVTDHPLLDGIKELVPVSILNFCIKSLKD